MAHKKLINSPDTVVDDMLEGLSRAYPDLTIDIESKICLLNRERKHRVGLLSGGGSGHEPFSMGYVGEGMLTGAVAGNIFASPTICHILTAIRNLCELNRGGVLVIVLNYTGDVLNFGLAIESAKSQGYKVEGVVVDDDCATPKDDPTKIVGSRGICGALFLFKILGTMSTAGRVLSELVEEASAIKCRLGTMGFALYPCTLPNSDEPLFEIGEGQIELGVGIHGEAGVAANKMVTAKEIVKIILARILTNLVVKPGDSVCVMVNNLGSCPNMEQLIIVKEAYSQLVELGYIVIRVYTGTLMTSCDMKGIQISILDVTERDDWIKFLDVETEAFAWPGKRLSHELIKHKKAPLDFTPDDSVPSVETGWELTIEASKWFKASLLAACSVLSANEEKLNSLDSKSGDGDCGTSFKLFCQGLSKEIDTIPFTKVTTTFLRLSKIAEKHMGGTSGAIYSLLFIGASKNFTDWASAWKNSIDMIQKYSRAQLGDRTMLDALIPAYEAYVAKQKVGAPGQWSDALRSAVDKAKDGCDKTLGMKARAGRAAYVEPSKVNDVDPGAYAVYIWLKAIADFLAPVPVPYIKSNSLLPTDVILGRRSQRKGTLGSNYLS